MERFEQLAAAGGDTDVLSAVEMARAAQGMRVAKLQAPPAIGATCDFATEPEPEPELEPAVSAPIAVPVGPAIGFESPGVDGREAEQHPYGYVGMSSGGPACASPSHKKKTMSLSHSWHSVAPRKSDTRMARRVCRCADPGDGRARCLRARAVPAAVRSCSGGGQAEGLSFISL